LRGNPRPQWALSPVNLPRRSQARDERLRCPATKPHRRPCRRHPPAHGVATAARPPAGASAPRRTLAGDRRACPDARAAPQTPWQRARPPRGAQHRPPQGATDALERADAPQLFSCAYRGVECPIRFDRAASTQWPWSMGVAPSRSTLGMNNTTSTRLSPATSPDQQRSAPACVKPQWRAPRDGDGGEADEGDRTRALADGLGDAAASGVGRRRAEVPAAEVVAAPARRWDDTS
jgi:hypothetical protein